MVTSGFCTIGFVEAPVTRSWVEASVSKGGARELGPKWVRRSSRPAEEVDSVSTRHQSRRSREDITGTDPEYEPCPNSTTLSTFRIASLSVRSPRPSAPSSTKGRDSRVACFRVEELPHARDDLHPTWRAAYERGKRLCPSVDITYGELAAHVGELGRAEAPCQAADLFLAAACALGRRAALAVLDKHIERSRTVVARVVRETWVVDDILQDVRYRLFVGGSPKIRSYKGTGPLGSWIRTVAINVAKDHVRAEGVRRGRETGGPSAGFPAEAAEVEREAARAIAYRGRAPLCIEAVRLAFESLETEERQLLHDHFFSGQSIDILGPRHFVNRATIARRIHRAIDKVRQCLRERLTPSYAREEPRTLDSIALLVCRDILDAAELLEPRPSALSPSSDVP